MLSQSWRELYACSENGHGYDNAPNADNMDQAIGIAAHKIRFDNAICKGGLE